MKAASLLLVMALLIIAIPASAQDKRPPPQPATVHARDISKFCPSHWENASCLLAVSQSNYDLTLSYAKALSAAGMGQATEGLKEYCAAATALESDIPAYAYTSAYTECANGMYDISEATGVAPDASHYQLLVAAVLCLSKDPRCAALESQMKK